MGSLGEDDLEKLVIDYIEPPPVIFSDHIEKSSIALLTLQEILERKGVEEKEIEEKINSYMKRRRLTYEGDDLKKDVMKKIVSMLRSDGYDASLSKTTWDSSFDLREGCRVFRHTVKYEYVDVMVTSGRVIIDFDFRSQFELAKPTKDYKEMSEMLPRLFVAKEERVKRVVKLVCCEMKESMKEEGMYRPPWRTTRYMQAKWLSQNRLRGSDEEEAGGSTKTKCCFPIF